MGVDSGSLVLLMIPIYGWRTLLSEAVPACLPLLSDPGIASLS